VSRDAAFAELVVAGGTARGVVRPERVRHLCEGHFPGDPIVPGAHLVGLMAAVAGAALAPAGAGPELAEIERAAFIARVTPADDVVVTAHRDGATRVQAEVHAGETCAARGTFRFRVSP
jgi:3-hydroxymyristoyl/3-hydroxydecanoyl-(acyl carrier protein) dehydratase